MKEYDAIIIGHITQDHNVDHEGNEVFVQGGAVNFSSASAYALGHNVAAITRLNKKDYGRLDAFLIPKEDIYCIESPSSSTMYNRYFTADKERRECRCSSVGTPFTLDDIPEGISGKIIHFAGLVFGDYSSQMMLDAAKIAPIAVDVQTCLRHVAEDGSMYFEDWADKKKVLPYVTYLKTDAAEAEILTGLTDRAEAAKLLYSWGAKEVLITHNTEVLAYDGKDMLTCPIRSRNLSGRTGRGDTTFAAYYTERLCSDMRSALLYATATVSLKMEKSGPFAGTRADVDEYIKEFYKDFI